MIVLIMITAYLNGKLVLDIDNGILLLALIYDVSLSEVYNDNNNRV